MNEYLEKLQARWADLAVRERALVLCAVLAGIYGIFDSVLLLPMDEERARLEGALARAGEETEQLEARSRALAEQVKSGAGNPLAREEAAIRDQIRSLDHRIQERLASMIPPGEVTKMLEALLAEESELELLRLASLEAPDASHSSAGGETGTAARKPEFFRHGFQLELEGGYLSTLHYLEAIESLSWDLSWDHIVYEVTEYPRAKVTIELHTLSDEEDWIGV